MIENEFWNDQYVYAPTYQCRRCRQKFKSDLRLTSNATQVRARRAETKTLVHQCGQSAIGICDLTGYERVEK